MAKPELSKVLTNHSPVLKTIPNASKAPTAIKMPRKKRMLAFQFLLMRDV